MGQEVGVTPLQMVSMVSTIANGGMYLPPHVLMPGQFDRTQTTPQSTAAPPPAAPKASPFKPGEELPNPLPAGAHRVLSTMTAAEMRKMMEGVVLYGTGKEAQLNGYSSGGKTGTAQKIDPATHLYSKTMHIASFAGIAPVNNPVIAVAVILDTPKGAYYGAAVSAPVFAEVAQQILEYLGVPHDIEVHSPRPGSKAKAVMVEEDSTEHAGDINALYSAANELPSDDPLRAAQAAPATPPPPQPVSVARPAPAPAVTKGSAQTQPNQAQTQPGAEVVLSEAKRLQVPSFIGLPVRKVIEKADAAGFEVAITGSGTVREQAPAPGTMVEPGTRVAVRCGR
jgi:cell division protein FtsI (penicillin-binding protein 3)